MTLQWRLIACIGAEGEGAVLVDAEDVLVDVENPAHQVQLLRFAQEQLGELPYRWQVLAAIADQAPAVGTLVQRGDRWLELCQTAQQASQGILVRGERDGQPHVVVERASPEAPGETGPEPDGHRHAVIPRRSRFAGEPQAGLFAQTATDARVQPRLGLLYAAKGISRDTLQEGRDGNRHATHLTLRKAAPAESPRRPGGPVEADGPGRWSRLAVEHRVQVGDRRRARHGHRGVASGQPRVGLVDG